MENHSVEFVDLYYPCKWHISEYFTHYGKKYISPNYLKVFIDEKYILLFVVYVLKILLKVHMYDCSYLDNVLLVYSSATNNRTIHEAEKKSLLCAHHQCRRPCNNINNS